MSRFRGVAWRGVATFSAQIAYFYPKHLGMEWNLNK